MQVHPVRLALGVVNAGPEQVAALALHRAGDPWLAVRRLGPDEAAVPGRALGLMRAAGIGDADRGRLAGGQGAGQGDGQAALWIAPADDRLAVHGDGGDGEQRVQLDHDSASRGRGGEVENSDALDRLGLGQQFERQVGLVETQGQLFGRAGCAAGQGEGARIADRFLGQCGRRQQGGGQAEGGSQAQGFGSGGCRATVASVGKRAKKKAGVSTGLFKSCQTALIKRRSAQPAWP
ncbi:hypothetical protein D3C72_1614680 [compost metagenome]